MIPPKHSKEGNCMGENIVGMITQKYLPKTEKDNLLTKEFDELWKNIWCDMKTSNQYKMEEVSSKDKFPLSGFSRPAIVFKNVVFPDKVLPKIVYKFPFLKLNETSFK